MEMTRLRKVAGRQQIGTIALSVVMIAIGALGITGYLTRADLWLFLAVQTPFGLVLLYGAVRKWISTPGR